MPRIFEFEGVEYELPDDATIQDFNRFIARREQTARSAALGGPTVAPEEQARLDAEAMRWADSAKQVFLSQENTDAPGDDPYPIEIGLAVAGAGAGVLGWVIARRTLLAARPKLTRKWFGVLGPVMWRCGRCGSEVALRSIHCEKCGQGQVWPRWVAS